MQCQGRAKEVSVLRKDLILEGVKTSYVTVNLCQELSLAGFMVVAMAAFITQEPELMRGESHEFDETGLPIFGSIQKVMTEGVLILHLVP